MSEFCRLVNVSLSTYHYRRSKSSVSVEHGSRTRLEPRLRERCLELAKNLPDVRLSQDLGTAGSGSTERHNTRPDRRSLPDIRHLQREDFPANLMRRDPGRRKLLVDCQCHRWGATEKELVFSQVTQVSCEHIYIHPTTFTGPVGLI